MFVDNLLSQTIVTSNMLPLATFKTRDDESVVTRPAADAVDVYRLQGILVFHDFRVNLVLEHSERPQCRITSSETISKAKSWPASALILYRSGTCIDFTHL